MGMGSESRASRPVEKEHTHSRRTVAGLALLLGLGSAVVFGVLGEEIQDSEPVAVDTGAAQFLHGYASAPLDTAMMLASFLGSAYFVIPLLALVALLLLTRLRVAEAVFLSTAYAGSGALNYLLKLLFHRMRPSLPWSPGAPDFSFPSGHSMNSFTFYVGLAVVVWLVLGRRAGIAALAGGLLVVLLVGVSRVYLGYHYVSDVLGGYSAALLWLMVWAAAFSAIWRRFGTRLGGRFGARAPLSG
ncbi:MAG: phosphatase PAP2 family protein [Candidatus Dormibacteraeota bacterium]|nr:phosphatase PAP2 family protein [Candidatus Dormibacteraeota bacterium]